MNDKQKRAASLTQTGGRSGDCKLTREKKVPETSIHQIFAHIKNNFIFALLAVAVLAFAFACLCNPKPDADAVAEDPRTFKTAPADPPASYVFTYDEGQPIDLRELTNAWAAEAGFTKFYELSDPERWELASVITAEAGGEPMAGKVAVAQCILQSCWDDDLRPSEALRKYGYSKRRPEPTWEAIQAVAAVFDFGHLACNEPIKYFYAPTVTRSDWHESQVYVLTINNHKFFKEARP